MKIILIILAFVAIASRIEAKKRCYPVPVTLPPPTPVTEPPQPICRKAFESYNDCGSACPLTCENKDKIFACTLQCVEGCFCDTGYVRNAKGDCILPTACPKPACTKPNEVYGDCGANPCEATCDQPDRPKICKAACRPGCGCKQGYIRHPNGNCVLPRQCPAKPVCKKRNESYQECGPTDDCEIRCDRPTGGFACPKECVKGCFCDAGYVRDSKGNCILQKDCPAPQPICRKAFESYQTCGSACPLTCENKDKLTVCTAQCVEGCFCNTGYVRNAKGDCILEKDCPAPQPVCGSNEIYNNCGPVRGCQESCTGKVNPTAICTKNCNKGCYCKQGYVRDTNGVCILKKDCPAPQPVCDIKKNEVYSQCGANGCQNTCANPTLSQVCKAICIAGCVCAEGYIRNANKDCVLPSQCPGTQPTCSKSHEVYQDCGTACPRTCANKDAESIICTKQCVKGCFCATGYVRNANGDCILPNKCPANTCGTNEEWSPCNFFCADAERRCDNLIHPAQCRPSACTSGCICKEGYYRNSNKRCVLEKQCPKPVKCGENEVYDNCSTLCGEKTCASRVDRYCGLGCQEKCLCKDGYIRDGVKGKCIKLEDCPAPPPIIVD